jgi:glycopeptide antibiotics resistance protein
VDSDSRPRLRRLFGTAFLVYAALVLAITIFPIHPRPDSYWLGAPWWTMIHWIPGDVDAPSFVLNVIMLIPYGVLAPLLWRRFDSVRSLALLAVASSSGIEAVQFVIGVTLGSRRTVDVNDLIANTGGALVGLLILRLALPYASQRRVVRS